MNLVVITLGTSDVQIDIANKDLSEVQFSKSKGEQDIFKINQLPDVAIEIKKIEIMITLI